jgi:hypothetical protein
MISDASNDPRNLPHALVSNFRCSLPISSASSSPSLLASLSASGQIQLIDAHSHSVLWAANLRSHSHGIGGPSSASAGAAAANAASSGSGSSTGAALGTSSSSAGSVGSGGFPLPISPETVYLHATIDPCAFFIGDHKSLSDVASLSSSAAQPLSSSSSPLAASTSSASAVPLSPSAPSPLSSLSALSALSHSPSSASSASSTFASLHRIPLPRRMSRQLAAHRTAINQQPRGLALSRETQAANDYAADDDHDDDANDDHTADTETDDDDDEALVLVAWDGQTLICHPRMRAWYAFRPDVFGATAPSSSSAGPGAGAGAGAGTLTASTAGSALGAAAATATGAGTSSSYDSSASSSSAFALSNNTTIVASCAGTYSLHAGRAHSVLVYATNLDCLELYVVEEVLQPRTRRDATATMGRRVGASKQKGATASVGDGPIPRQRLAFADAANTASAANHTGVDSDTQTTGAGAGASGHAGYDGQPAAFEGDNDADDSEGSAYWAPDTTSLVDFIQVCTVLLHFGTRHTLSYILSRMVHPIVSLWCCATANDGDRNTHAPPLSAALAARATTKIWRA